MIHILGGLILGIVLIQFGLPVLDGLAALVMTMLEAAKGYFGIIVAKYNTKITSILNQEENTVKNTIGFTLPEEEEDNCEVL